MIILCKARQKKLVLRNVDVYVWMSFSIIYLTTLILTCLWMSGRVLTKALRYPKTVKLIYPKTDLSKTAPISHQFFPQLQHHILHHRLSFCWRSVSRVEWYKLPFLKGDQIKLPRVYLSFFKWAPNNGTGFQNGCWLFERIIHSATGVNFLIKSVLCRLTVLNRIQLRICWVCAKKNVWTQVLKADLG